jgi:membrane protein insertase Oxa1/YidC/SpoIIIJ
MPAPLNYETVRRRLMEFPRDNYLYIGSFMRSVALAAGSIIILEILAGELLSRFILWHRIRNSSLLNDFEPEMQKLATEYHLWIRKDRKAAAAGAGLAFVFGCFALTMLPLWFQGACYFIIYDLLAVPFIFIFAYACWRSDQQRQRIDEYVFTLRSSNDQRGG